MKFSVCFTFGSDDFFLSFENVEFPGCISVGEVRTWINSSGRFISMDDQLINLDQVTHIYLKKVE